MDGMTPREDDLAHAGSRAAEVIRGLGNYAAFLAAHPDLPLDDGNPLHCCVTGGTDEDERAEVDRIAGILGTAARYMPGSETHYAAERDFGGVTYLAVAITARHMAEHSAWSSYCGAVQPESLVAA